MKSASIVCGILLLIGIAQLPIGYYTFLRVIVTVCAVAVIVTELKLMNSIWLIPFIIIALVFNPIIPVYLYQKSIWIPIDAIAAVVFIVYGFKYKKHQNV